MKRRFVQQVVFVVFLVALFLPLLRFVFAPAPPVTFNVSVTISNIAPRIHNITINGGIPPFSFSPTENTSTNLSIVFNVTDGNGQADILDQSVFAQINLSVTRPNFTGCALLTTGTNDKKYNCTVQLFWFDENGSTTNKGYDINVTAQDSAGSIAQNYTPNSISYTVLTAIELTTNVLSFAGTPGTNGVRPTNNLTIRNTGNDQFRQINVTIYDLNGVSQVLAASNFSINVTNTDTAGNIFAGVSNVTANGTNFTFSNTTLWISRGNGSNQSLYFAVNLTANLNEKSYNASKLWSIGVNRV